MACRRVRKPPYEWVRQVVETVLDDWDILDGYYLSQGTDLVGLAEVYDADRVINIFESVILEEEMRNRSIPNDERINFRKYMKKLRQGGTISSEEIFGTEDSQPPVQNNGWTNDGIPRQPPRYIEPTEGGYPGLEPPVG